MIIPRDIYQQAMTREAVLRSFATEEGDRMHSIRRKGECSLRVDPVAIEKSRNLFFCNSLVLV